MILCSFRDSCPGGKEYRELLTINRKEEEMKRREEVREVRNSQIIYIIKLYISIIIHCMYYIATSLFRASNARYQPCWDNGTSGNNIKNSYEKAEFPEVMACIKWNLYTYWKSGWWSYWGVQKLKKRFLFERRFLFECSGELEHWQQICKLIT